MRTFRELPLWTRVVTSHSCITDIYRADHSFTGAAIHYMQKLREGLALQGVMGEKLGLADVINARLQLESSGQDKINKFPN